MRRVEAMGERCVGILAECVGARKPLEGSETGNREQGTGNREQATDNRQSRTGTGSRNGERGSYVSKNGPGPRCGAGQPRRSKGARQVLSPRSSTSRAGTWCICDEQRRQRDQEPAAQ